MEKIPMTRSGFDQLDAELRDLKGTERPAIIAATPDGAAAPEVMPAT